jgi:hypothetical protein
MGLVDEIRLQGVTTRITEEILYAEVLREIESGIRRDGLWAKALSQSNMQQDAAKARYIKLRVQSLKDEVEIALQNISRQTAALKVSSSHQSNTINIDNKFLAPFDVGNFGFGLVLLGPLVNLGLFAAILTLGVEASEIYNPWWLIPFIVCIASGWFWERFGRKKNR